MNERGVNITAVSWAFGGVALGVVGMRLYTRVVALRRAGWDDFFIALSLVNALICSSFVQVAVHYGLGRHMSDIADPSQQLLAFKYTVIARNFPIVSTTTGKMSVTIFLLRFMGQSGSTARRWLLYVLMAFVRIDGGLCGMERTGSRAHHWVLPTGRAYLEFEC